MTQTTINQRLKFLIEALDISIRSFSSALDVSEATTRNYLDRGTKPPSDYLEKIVRHFSRANPLYLLTGDGEPLLSSANETKAGYQNFSGSNSIGQNTGTGSVTQTHNEGVAATECAQQLEMARREIELLKGQLTDKERIIKLLERHMPS